MSKFGRRTGPGSPSFIAVARASTMSARSSAKPLHPSLKSERLSLLRNGLSSKESTMSYFPGMQKGNLDSVKADEHGKIKKETVSLQGVSVTRVTFDVGAKWSNDLKGIVRKTTCWIGGVRRRLRAWLRSPIAGIVFRRSSSSTLCVAVPSLHPK